MQYSKIIWTHFS